MQMLLNIIKDFSTIKRKEKKSLTNAQLSWRKKKSGRERLNFVH